MNKLRIKKHDQSEARWFEFNEEVQFLIAPLSKDEYQIGIEKARRLISKQDGKTSLHMIEINSEDRLEIDVQADLLSRYILLDWKGPIENDEGKNIQYSKESAYILLKYNLDFLAWVVVKATELAVDQEEEDKETLGKLSKGSNGKVNGKTKEVSKD